MLIKKFMNTLAMIDNRIKTDGIYLALFCGAVIAGLIIMAVFSKETGVNYIYNQF